MIGSTIAEPIKAAPTKAVPDHHPFVPLPRLRDYQEKLRQDASHAVARGKKRVLLYMATGAGKTITAIDIMIRAIKKGKRVMFVVRQSVLVPQTLEKLKAHKVGHLVAICKSGFDSGHWTGSGAKPIVLAGVKSLETRFKKGVIGSLPPADLIILDEAHNTIAPEYDFLFRNYPDAVILGLTATPFRLNPQESMEDRYEELVIGPQTYELVNEGYLVPPEVYKLPEGSLNLDEVSVIAGDFDEEQLAIKCNTPAMIEAMIREWRIRALNLPTIVFAVNVEHAKAIRDAFEAEGIPAVTVIDKTSIAERGVIFKAFQEGRIKILTSVGALCEGFDVPEIKCVVLARPTQSLSMYIQMVGRGLRPAPGKTHCVVLDQALNHYRHGHPLEPLKNLTLTKQKPVKVAGPSKPSTKQCPACDFTLSLNARKCKKCDFVFESKKRFELPVRMELATVYAGSDSPYELLDKLIEIAINRGYKMGWATRKFFDRVPGPDEPLLKYAAMRLGYSSGWVHHQLNERNAVSWARRRD